MCADATAPVPDWRTVHSEERPRAPIELVVLQPTPFCNLDCDYCYLPERSDRRRMTGAVLEASFARVFESGRLGDRLTVAWHAGEPTVLPASFYADAMAIAERLRPAGLSLVHSFQTNATNLDEAWIALLKDPWVSVGVSLDGPATLHDLHRRDRRGRGSHARTMAGVRRLQAEDIPFHVIAVLTAESLRDPPGLIDFFAAAGIRHIGFNIDEAEGVHPRSSMERQGIDAAFRRFLKMVLVSARANSEHRLHIREFAGAFAEIADPRTQTYGNQQAEPFRILNIDVAGNVTTFSPELVGARDRRYGNFVIGNVLSQSLAEMARSPVLAGLEGEIAAGVEACRRSCEYFRFCRGGAPANKLFETGRFDTTETLYCRLARQAVFDVVLEDLETGLGCLAPPPPRRESANVEGPRQTARMTR